MFETWRLEGFAPGEGVASGAFKEDFDEAEWLRVPVPGDVHRTLIEAGRIPDPYYDRNEEECAWVEDREWWYRLTFDGPARAPGPDERLRLVFHGLDTFVTVWLNGEEIGEHANMFREAVFDVTDRLRVGGSNTLALCFHRPLERAVEGPGDQWGRNPERVGMRKAQFGYGWDWGPRLPTVGIWRPVDLVRERGARISGVHFYTCELSRDGKTALAAVRVEAERFATDERLSARIKLSVAGEEAVERAVALRNDGPERTVYLEVEDPRLWWTHDLGEPALYDLEVVLEDESGELDRREQEVGIRTLELDQSPDPDEPGTRFFRFMLNGVPIFARGADWIPADSFVGAIEAGRYETLLGRAREANMNMLRVWGGGIYEHDAFYEGCNRLGLLVWQDFMFACATYPEGPSEFVSEVDAEARYQVRRLRSHPCLALWCGNNENQWIHDRTYPHRENERVPGSLYYDEILPRAVSELDGRIPYWPGSPYGGDDHNDRRQGNVHDWEVWHGNFPRRFGEDSRRDPSPENVSYLRYAEDMGRFISEFGMHASPVMETLRRAIPPDQLYHHSPSMDHHNKDDPKNKGDNLMLTVTGLPETLEEYVDYSMISQAEGLKFAIEHFRRRKPHCSGTLFWQFNDCWPVLSWSVLDYHGFGKAGYYYAKRAYAPVLASFKQTESGAVELWITNDTLSGVRDTATVSLRSFAGETLWTETVRLDLAPNSSHRVAAWSAGAVSATNERYLAVRASGGSFEDNRHFFCPVKDLCREATEPAVEIARKGQNRLEVLLRADTYAYFVHLTTESPSARFSDNYFDVEPGTERRITVTGDGELTPDMLSIGYR